MMSFESRGNFVKFKKIRRSAHHDVLLRVFAASLAHAHTPQVNILYILYI